MAKIPVFSAMFGYVWDKLPSMILAALILFSVWNAIELVGPERLDEIADETGTAALRKAGSFWLWSMSINGLNPTFRYELPFIDKYIIGINDIPYFDATDLFFMLPIVLIVNWALSRKNVSLSQNPFFDKLYKALILLVVLLLSFLMAKVIWYIIFVFTSGELGLTMTEAITIREDLLLAVDDVKLVFLAISVIGAIAILKEKFKKK